MNLDCTIISCMPKYGVSQGLCVLFVNWLFSLSNMNIEERQLIIDERMTNIKVRFYNSFLNGSLKLSYNH